MARHPRKRQDPQCDPFNAGEPVLPWDDPAALHDDGCAYVDGPDGYEAPAYEAATYEAPPKAKKAAPKRRTSSRPAVPSSPKSADSRNAKVAHLMKAWVAIVLVMAVFSCGASAVEGIFGGLSGFLSDAPSFDDFGYEEAPQIDYPFEQSEQDAETCQEIVDERLADTDALRSLAATAFDQRLVDVFGGGAEELGLDADAYAEWAVEHTLLSPARVYCFLDYGDESPYGNAYVDVVIPGKQAFYTFEDELFGYLSGEGLFGPYESGETAALLGEAQKERVRELFSNALAEAEAATEQSIVAFSMKSDAGTWTMDETEFASEMEWLLGY